MDFEHKVHEVSYTIELTPKELLGAIQTVVDFGESTIKTSEQFAEFVLQQPGNILSSAEDFIKSMPDAAGNFFGGAKGILEDLGGVLRRLFRVKLFYENEIPQAVMLAWVNERQSMGKKNDKVISLKKARSKLKKSIRKLEKMIDRMRELNLDRRPSKRILKDLKDALATIENKVAKKKVVFNKLRKAKPKNENEKDVLTELATKLKFKYTIKIEFYVVVTDAGAKLSVRCHGNSKDLELKDASFPVFAYFPGRVEVVIKYVDISKEYIRFVIAGTVTVGVKFRNPFTGKDQKLEECKDIALCPVQLKF